MASSTSANRTSLNVNLTLMELASTDSPPPVGAATGNPVAGSMVIAPPAGVMTAEAAAAFGLKRKLIPFLSGSRNLACSLRLRSTSLNGRPSGQETLSEVLRNLSEQ